MIDLNGYEDVSPSLPGEFPRLPADGYICRVVNVELTTSKSDKPMLVLFVDIAEGNFAGFFKNAVDRIKSFNYAFKWDSSATYRQLVFGNDGLTSRFFKGLLSCFELSNPYLKFNPHAFDEKILRGCLIGFVFAEEEYFKQNGTIGTRTFIKFPKSVADIRNRNFKVPDFKELPPDAQKPPAKSFYDQEAFDPNDIPF